MKQSFLLMTAALLSAAPAPAPAQTPPALTITTVITNLHVPWEILWGPDDRIWFTERNGRVSRMDPSTGQRTVILTVESVWEQGESGMLGMAFHPAFSDTPHVFIAYTHRPDGSGFVRVERYTWTGSTLSSPRILIDSLDAGSIHNGCRLLILPDLTLLMTTGNATGDNDPASPSLDTSRLEGKLLRMHLDGSVPADNPFPGSLVYTYGHRNPQGLARLPNGSVFISEHGPSSDDEINRVVKGGNYGWPAVRGFCDQTAELDYCDSLPVVEPINAWTPTIAPAGLDYYYHAAIPAWRNSLLLTTLQERDFRVLRLNDAGDAIVGEIILLNEQFGRLRDLCVSPTGDVYVATSNTDGRGTVRSGDDRIVRLSTLTSAIGDGAGTTRRSVTAARVKVRGSTVVISGVRDPGTFLVLYDLAGRPVQRFSPADGSIHEAGVLTGGVYGYRLMSAGGTAVMGTLVVPGR